MHTRTLQVVVWLLLAVVLLLSAWPQLFGLERAELFAQAVSLRGAAVVLAVLGVVMLASVALYLKPIRRFVSAVAVLLAVFAVSTALVLVARGFGSAPAWSTGTLTVLSWNTMGDAPGAQAIADLALDNNAKIVSLPETTSATAQRVAGIMAAAGTPMTAHTVAYDQVSKGRSTSLLISATLGEYRIDASHGNTAVLPTVTAVPVNRVGPTIIAVHAVSPVHDERSNWQEDLSWLSEQCRQHNVIMAGDFNATIDHMHDLGHDDLGNCADAAMQAHSAAVGTWPTLIPPLVGTPIDHVMFSDQWRAAGMRVVTDHDDAGSDHRPILVRLKPVSDPVDKSATP